MAASSTSVTHNASKRRFQIADEPSAFLQYTEEGGRIRLIHTEVPSALGGRGYASALAHAALEYARGLNLRVDPICPFVRAYLQRHPEYAPLLEAKPNPRG
jgi:predicted GNAT family acetyltransferase